MRWFLDMDIGTGECGCFSGAGEGTSLTCPFRTCPASRAAWLTEGGSEREEKRGMCHGVRKHRSMCQSRRAMHFHQPSQGLTGTMVVWIPFSYVPFPFSIYLRKGSI
jgi:hypothetical protein